MWLPPNESGPGGEEVNLRFSGGYDDCMYASEGKRPERRFKEPTVLGGSEGEPTFGVLAPEGGFDGEPLLGPEVG